jgi:hypothetical protein
MINMWQSIDYDTANLLTENFKTRSIRFTRGVIVLLVDHGRLMIQANPDGEKLMYLFKEE